MNKLWKVVKALWNVVELPVYFCLALLFVQQIVGLPRLEAWVLATGIWVVLYVGRRADRTEKILEEMRLDAKVREGFEEDAEHTQRVFLATGK